MNVSRRQFFKGLGAVIGSAGLCSAVNINNVFAAEKNLSGRAKSALNGLVTALICLHPAKEKNTV